MKKTAIIGLLACAMLTACGGEAAPAATAAPAETPAPAAAETAQTAPAPESAAAPESTAPDYGPLAFDYHGLSFGIFDEAAPVLDALGAPDDTFTADSCAYQGQDCYYYYDGIELCVNDIDGTERITGITLADDTVQTPQGFRIGMDAAALAEGGLEYTLNDGVYSFTYGSTLLRIRDGGDGAVTAIAYMPAE